MVILMSQERPLVTGREAVATAPERPALFEFRTLEDARAYRQWKQDVPASFRKMVEAVVQGNVPVVTPVGLPRVDAFLKVLGTCLADPDRDIPDDPLHATSHIQGLRSVKTNAGRADGIKLLADPSVDFGVKRDLWRDHIEPLIHWLREQDLAPPEEARDGEHAEEDEIEAQDEMQTQDNVPPPDQDSFQPSMDEMEKGNEGEPNAYFTVAPFYGGYYRQKTYGTWNSRTLSWESTPTEHHPLEAVALDPLSVRVLNGSVCGGKPLSLPIPYNWFIDKATIETDAPKEAIRLTQDNAGTIQIEIAAEGIHTYHIRIAKQLRTVSLKGQPMDAEKTTNVRLPDELRRVVAETGAMSIPSSAKARALIKCVRDHLEYSNDSSMNAVYRQDPVKYFERIWQEKKADCDVANTVAAAVLRSAGIACRLVTGHYVKSQTKDNRALLTSGTGHAWLEVYDEDTKTWFRADATPKGDPALDEERPDEQQESGEGDYGEQEAELMSDEDLEKLIQELEQTPGTPPPETKTSEQRTEEKFAEQAACSLAEAREVLEAFRRVREMRNAKGERISEGLISEWNQLVRTRLRKAMEYTGPVRRSEGDELVDPVTMRLDRRAGDRNPGGYERFAPIEKREELFGGLDVYLQLDLSGSMSEIDQVSHQKKCEMQRDFALLYADSLMQCAVLSRQAQGRLKAPLPIRLQIVSIHGDASVDLPLCNEWGPKEQVALYRAAVRTAGGGTPDHAGLHLIEQRIRAEREAWTLAKHKPHEKPPIEFVAVSLDGGSDRKDLVQAALGRLRHQGTVVYGYGMTVAAKPVEAIYAPNGNVLHTLAEHAEIAAQDTIAIFKRLYPEQVKG